MVVLDPVVSQKARQTARVLARRVVVRAAFVFGSRARGEGDRWSDLDVAAFVDGIDGWDLKQRVQLITSVQAAMDDEIELHLFPARFIDNPPTASLSQLVLREGVRIHESPDWKLSPLPGSREVRGPV